VLSAGGLLWNPDGLAIEQNGDLVVTDVAAGRLVRIAVLCDVGEDLDADGVVDPTETDPRVADTDGDGLGDGAEVNTYGTDPLDWDTDGDRYSDGAEVDHYGTDPLDEKDHPPYRAVPALGLLGRVLVALLLALSAAGWFGRRRSAARKD
jgi:hypothetical protein